MSTQTIVIENLCNNVLKLQRGTGQTLDIDGGTVFMFFVFLRRGTIYENMTSAYAAYDSREFPIFIELHPIHNLGCSIREVYVHILWMTLHTLLSHHWHHLNPHCLWDCCYMLKKVMSTCRQTGTGHPCWVTDGSMGSKTENIPLAFTFCVRKLSIKSIQSKLLVTSVNDLCSWWYLFIFINILQVIHVSSLTNSIILKVKSASWQAQFKLWFNMGVAVIFLQGIRLVLVRTRLSRGLFHTKSEQVNDSVWETNP